MKIKGTKEEDSYKEKSTKNSSVSFFFFFKTTITSGLCSKALSRQLPPCLWTQCSRSCPSTGRPSWPFWSRCSSSPSRSCWARRRRNARTCSAWWPSSGCASCCPWQWPRSSRWPSSPWWGSSPPQTRPCSTWRGLACYSSEVTYPCQYWTLSCIFFECFWVFFQQKNNVATILNQ